MKAPRRKKPAETPAERPKTGDRVIEDSVCSNGHGSAKADPTSTTCRHCGAPVEDVRFVLRNRP